MTETKPSTIVGIDLGTTYSCIAHVDETGRPVTLKNSDGFLTTPSVVFFESPENVIVGETAKNAMKTDPEKVVAFVKRSMGDPNATYQVDGKSYRPEEVSSFVLKRLIKDASEFLREPVTDAVITVPAYFGDNHRAATEQAGKIAGLNVLSIINEPTAAAISYGMDQADDQVVLVFDLGGGTFDVTLIEIKERNINVVCTGGDHELGGKDWDERLINHLAACWGDQNGQPSYEVGEDRVTANDLRLEAEKYKVQLSAREKLGAMVTIEGQRAKVELTREKLDELTADLLDRTIELTRQMLQEAAKKGVTDFHRILLVGGATRMPQVKDRLQREFCKDIVIFDPDEAVAKGAALFAYHLALKGEVDKKIKEKVGEGMSAEESAKTAQREVARQHGLAETKMDKIVNTTIKNVTSKAFGVVALNEKEQEEVVFLISRNQTLPVDTTMPFATALQLQRNAEVKIMEGEREEATDPKMCFEIGQANLELPDGLPKGSPIEITFRMNEQGMLEATAKEVTKGGTINVAVDRGQSVMSDEQVEASRAALRRVSIS